MVGIGTAIQALQAAANTVTNRRMMTIFRQLTAALTMSVMALPAAAADFSDPTWPCVQRKVENLSLGLMWPAPVEPETLPDDANLRENIADLAGALALRRVDLEDLEADVATFASDIGGDGETLGHVFARVFGTLSKRRTRIINGIGEFSLSQIGLSEQIDTTRVEMDRLMSAENPDYDKVDALEEKLDWDQLIYTDRQRNLTYLCETPVLLERRLFGIAQMLQAQITE